MQEQGTVMTLESALALFRSASPWLKERIVHNADYCECGSCLVCAYRYFRNLAAENERLRERAAEAVKRLDGADYDLGRVLADGEADNDRIRDAWQGVREARALLEEEKDE